MTFIVFGDIAFSVDSSKKEETLRDLLNLLPLVDSADLAICATSGFLRLQLTLTVNRKKVVYERISRALHLCEPIDHS